MSFKWPDKDPDDILDYSIDWSRFLDGDTLSTVTWFCDDADNVKQNFDTPTTIVNGLQHVSNSNSNTTATIQLSLGTANTTYDLYCQVTTSGGLTAERKIRLRVREV